MSESDTDTAPAVRLKKNGRPAKPVGRHTSLTDETEAAVVAAIRNHQPFSVAAHLVPGVKKSAIYKYRQLGIEAQVFVEGGGRLSALSALERRCMEFVESVETAEAQAKGRAVRGWMSAGLERQTERTTRRKFAGMDEHGQPIMVTEETVKETPPDARLLVEWLERRYPGEYRKAGADVDITLDITVRAAALAERVRAAIAVESSEVEP